MKITIEIRRKDQPIKWWHRIILAIHPFFAGVNAPRFAIILSTGHHGTLYVTGDREVSRQLLEHEAQHVVQSVKAGDLRFRARYLLIRDRRLEYEAEAYAVGFRYNSRPEILALETIEHNAKAYLFGTITSEDAQRIVEIGLRALELPVPDIEVIDSRAFGA